MVTQLAPITRVSNYFGFTNSFDRINAALGPIVWSANIFFFTGLIGISVSMATRFTIIVLVIILVVGLLILSQVTDHHARYLEGFRHIGNGKWEMGNGKKYTD